MASGEEIYRLVVDLFPICRSITGDGLRRSLRIIQGLIPLEVHEIPTGTQVFDWTVPNEWNIRDGYVKDPAGRKVLDFKDSNLHVLNYSLPIDTRIPLSELKGHLFTLPEHPDWIPYKTSYYSENWGFCLSQSSLDRLEDGIYEVWIDSTLAPGSLTYGELFLPGESEAEILISCHCCHPSMCNDNLSGMALATYVARQLAETPRRYSYRFLFIPGTIGSLTWLALNEEGVSRIRHGLVVTCVGDPGNLSYKKSRRGDAEIDRAVAHALKHSGSDFEVYDFTPFGNDERQYSSPGFDLPVGSLSRTPPGRYPEYHTSADNLDFVRPEYLDDSFRLYLSVFDILEGNRIHLNTNPRGEPQLGKRGLYSALGGKKDSDILESAILWVLNLSDGSHDLLDIAERSGLPFNRISEAATLLVDHELLTVLR